ncbi:hypothetical protein KJ966_03370 [bacterium]|nr:hypothetical protein [bacterium]
MKGVTISSKGDSSSLRDLHKIQLSVPDKDFFLHLKAELQTEDKKRKKGKKGFFAGGFFSGRKSGQIDLEVAREQIKSFNNSFKIRKTKQGTPEIVAPGLMSIQEMKDYRGAVKRSAEAEEEGHSYRALEAIVKFIDLRNSGVVSNKQDVLLDCLKNIGLALCEDGGLSMFHATWFFSVYKEYLGHYRMFRKGEYERASQIGNKEVKTIAKQLFRKQYELPHYLQLIDESKRDIKQLIKYAKDPFVKRSLHGQKGCSGQHIKKIFHDFLQDKPSKGTEQNYLNEVNIIMSYALFFCRIPMMTPLVDFIIKSIPNLGTETTLYKEKISISQKLIQLELMAGIGRNDGSDASVKKVQEDAYAIYKHCTNLITDNRLTKDTIKDDIHTFPFLRQAIVLINYRQVLNRNKKAFLKMLEDSLSILGVLSDAARSGQKNVLRIIEYVDVYERNLEAIIHQIKSELAE